ncbi:hypothetical protein KR50_11250 [Jeotgalibacillus campisalis]|uniref:Uncharacterized protein n=1 Tax=Jeotgalibacillus campisalis TaxID=220754 RepID=A0A0C2RFZ6_9BACL|nr:hypothetical protein KR50_11250 [Jeotgalibacillus campisalis]
MILNCEEYRDQVAGKEQDPGVSPGSFSCKKLYFKDLIFPAASYRNY